MSGVLPELFSGRDDYWVLKGPTTAISCEVEWDDEEECYVARGGGFVGTALSSTDAVMMCFNAWLNARRAWYEPQR